MANTMTLSYEERLKLARYLAEASIEADKLDAEVRRLERLIDVEPGAYSRYKKLIGARDAMREQCRQIEEMLRSE